MRLWFKFVFLLSIIALIIKGLAQDQTLFPDNTPYEFIIDKSVKHTPVKSQDSTGTCWIFSTLSFVESEMLRMGRGEVDLSEMYVARHLYPEKALNYFRLHGHATFSEGGLSHDVLMAIEKYGIVPEVEYPGRQIEDSIHNHFEMAAILKSLLNTIIDQKKGHLTSHWLDAFEAVLDNYLGPPPLKFVYEGKIFNPKSFSENYLNLDFDNYVELTSFLHHPFYQKFRLEVPDNWNYYHDYFNVTLDELEVVVDFALQNGFSLVWDGDVGDKYYADKEKGYATVPCEESSEDMMAERAVTPELRQENFDNFETTDDHLMHLVGIAKDQHNEKFYLVKDSWYTNTTYKGYIYLSRSYFRLKTIAIMVNKNGIPEKIRKKLDLKN